MKSTEQVVLNRNVIKNRAHVARTVLAIILMVTIVGCEEDIAAPGGLDKPFSAYGVLNARRDTQSLAVSPIAPLLFDYPDSIDAKVKTIDLQTGDNVSWKDSVVVGERGQTDHIFWALFRAEFGTSYEVEIARSDGEVSRAIAHVPPRVTISSRDFGDKYVLLNITGDEMNVVNIELVYSVRRYSRSMSDSVFCAPGREVVHTVGHDEDLYETPTGWGIQIDLEKAHQVLIDNTPMSWVPGRNGLAIMKVVANVAIGEERWTIPFNELNDYALQRPEDHSNLENGYGLIVGGYNEEARIYPSMDAVEATWFFDFIQRPPTDCLDYCACNRF